MSARELIDARVPGGEVTERGLRNNVSVGLQYLESWLRGTGAAGIANLMEDVATAEIARSQVWQWIYHGVAATDGAVSRSRVRTIADEELARLREAYGSAAYARMKFADARAVFEQVALSEQFTEFLTLVGLDYID